jgi:P27 family predicted phage terminase small subunit
MGKRRAGPKVLRLPAGGKARGGEPLELGEIPDKPAWLWPEAAAEWDRLAPGLAARGVLTAGAWGILAACCQSWGEYDRAQAFMRANGNVYVIRDDKGNVKFSQTVPQHGIAHKALEKYLRLAGELGLTPSAGARVKASDKRDPEPAGGGVAAILAGMRSAR